MIYPEPIYRPLGDCCLGIEFGDEANLELNFQVLALRQRIEEAQLDGVVELIPSFRELAVVIDRGRITHEKLRDAVRAIVADLGKVETLPSRRFRLPCWYDDPWSAAIARRYGVQNNIEFVAEQNDLTVAEVIEQHAGTEFWIVCVGFTPGAPFTYPLDSSRQLLAPKWKTPRDFTPARAVSLAGFSTGVYPVASPGGYQLLGRLAVNIYEPDPRNRAFPPDGVLLRAGDRFQLVPIDALEYDAIWTAVERGEYEHEVTEEPFDVAAYLEGARAVTAGS